LHAEVTGFVNDIRDYIFLAPFGAMGNALDSLAVRQGDARLAGFEAQAGVTLPFGWRFDAAADAVRAANRVTGGPLPFIPPVRTQGTLRWEGTSHTRLLKPSLQIGGEWQARQSRTFLNDFAPPAYGLLHLGASAGLSTARGVVWLDVSVRNATDARFRDFLNRYKEFAHGAGRAVVVRISTEF
jgi:iron complex outermembrane receptor protein